MTTGSGAPRRSRLVALVHRFVRADSWSASRALVERHPVLLSTAADDILTELGALASSRGDSAAKHALEVHQSLLRRYREVGDTAFDEVMAPGVPSALRQRWIAAEAAYERYRARPSRTAADSAITAIAPVLRDSDLAAAPAAARAGMRQAAGTLHGERYQRYGGTSADLDTAITCFSRAVRDLPADDRDYPSYASALGNVLGMRFEKRGDLADLDAAIRWSRTSATAMPAHERWWILHNLSANLGIRYELLGHAADLSEALKTARDALASEPPETAHTVLTHGVAVLLLDRYERDGDLDDLRSCIEIARADGSAGPRQERAALLGLLATALQLHSEHESSIAELDEATRFIGDAIRLLGKRSPHLPVAFGIQGQLYVTRFELNGTPADLLAAHAAYSQALKRVDTAAPHAVLLLSSKGTIEARLASLKLAGFSMDVAVSDLTCAADAADRSPRLRPFLLANLAAGLAARHRMLRRREDLEIGTSAYQKACAEALTYDLEVALKAALDWGAWAGTRDSWAEANRAYGLAFEAMDRIWRHQLGRPEKEVWLRTAWRLGSQAGLAAARADDLERAVVFLERGRARLLAESLELAPLDLSRLAKANADLARRFAAAADRLRGVDAITREQHTLAPQARPKLAEWPFASSR